MSRPRRITQALAADALEAAANVPGDTETQVVLFGGETTNDLHARRLNPTNALAAEFRGTAQAFARQLGRRSLVAYSAGRTPTDYEVAFASTETFPGLSVVLSEVESPVDIELFDPASTIARTLRFYIVGIRQPNPGWVHFIRSKGVTLRLKRTRKIAAVMRGAVYDELDEDPLIFDPGFDAIAVENVVLVVNQGAFERSLGFVDQAREVARQTLAQLTAQIRIANLDDFMAAATADVNMISKLRGIAEKLADNPDYAAAMTTDRLIAFAAENDLEIDVEEADGEQRLVFHSEPRRRWRILKLLDDDYLHSQLTELDYEVNSKSPLPT